jgi:hypothetical protein
MSIQNGGGTVAVGAGTVRHGRACRIHLLRLSFAILYKSSRTKKKKKKKKKGEG